MTGCFRLEDSDSDEGEQGRQKPKILKTCQYHMRQNFNFFRLLPPPAPSVYGPQNRRRLRVVQRIVPQPVVVRGEVAPHVSGQLFVALDLGGVQPSAFLNRGRGVLHLIDGDESRDGCRQRIATENVTQSHAGSLVVFFSRA